MRITAYKLSRVGGPRGLGKTALGALVLVGFTLTPTPGQGQSQWDALFHGARLSYSDSRVKDDGYVLGFYGTFGKDLTHLVEVGATRTGIDYLDGFKLSQNELAAAYSRFGLRGSARVGAHLLFSNDPLSDGGKVLFAGANAYEVGVWSLGAEGAWSTYPDFETGLRVAQVAPNAGFTLANASRTRFLGVSVRGYYIRLSEEIGLEDREFLSAEGTVSFTAGSLTVSAFAWGGEQAFAVRNGGFLVYNVAELHKGGYGGGFRWVLTPRSALSAGLYFEDFQDLDFSGDARSRTFTASFGITL
jgi:hypothetical protein